VIVLCFGGSLPAAQANIITFHPNANIFNSAFHFHFGNSGQAGYGVSYVRLPQYFGHVYYSFTDANSTNAFLGSDDTSISSHPATFAESAQIPGAVDSFASYSDHSVTPFHFALAIDDYTSPAFLDLKFSLSDGIHYGYAKLIPDEHILATYAYQSEPGVGIVAGALPDAAVPGPSSLGVLGLGLLLIGFGVTRRYRGEA
jgi:hypothetical protein